MIFDLLAATGESRYYLFKNGNTYPSRTGGFGKLTTNSGCTITIGEEIKLTGENDYSVGSARINTSNYIDFSKHTKVCVDVKSYKGSCRVWVESKYVSIQNTTVHRKDITSTGTVTLDLTKLYELLDKGETVHPREFRVYVIASTGSNYGDKCELSIRKIWLE